jgi:hypothetical protein
MATKPLYPPETAECDKMLKVQAKSQAIGEFLEWLGSNEVVLARWQRSRIEDRLMPLGASTENLLAEFFEIDLAKVEKEKRAILNYQRKLNRRTGHVQG